MKYSTILTLMLCSLAACGQKKDVPNVVADAFNQKFPEVKTPKWEMEEANEWEAEFKMDDMEYSASFDNAGKWLETEHEVDRKNLPKAITDALDAKYSDYEVEEAEMIDSPDQTGAYELEIEVDDKEMTVIVSSGGKVMKEEAGEEDKD